MTSREEDRPRAERPEDLGSFFIERANASDVDGLLALYERDAVLVSASGEVMRGIGAIRQALEAMVAGMAAHGTIVTGSPSPAVRRGDLALTSTRFSASSISADGQQSTRSGITVEVARLQSNGTWLVAIDQPNIVG